MLVNSYGNQTSLEVNFHTSKLSMLSIDAKSIYFWRMSTGDSMSMMLFY